VGWAARARAVMPDHPEEEEGEAEEDAERES
jgi:hypothetical protein